MPKDYRLSEGVKIANDYNGRMFSDQIIVPNAKLPTLFKVLDTKGVARNGGNQEFAWPLPKGTTPGEWVRHPDPIKLCYSGFHLTTYEGIHNWARTYSDRVFIAEVEGPGVANAPHTRWNNDGKYVVANARLVVEVPRAIARRYMTRSESPEATERDLARAVNDAKVDASNEYWREHYDEVWAVMESQLPTEVMPPEDVEYVRVFLDPRRVRETWRGIDTLAKTRHEYLAARLAYYKNIGHEETEAERQERLAAKNLTALLERFMRVFGTGDDLRRSLKRWGGATGTALAEGHTAVITAAERKIQAEFRHADKLMAAFEAAHGYTTVKAPTKTRTRTTRTR